MVAEAVPTSKPELWAGVECSFVRHDPPAVTALGKLLMQMRADPEVLGGAPGGWWRRPESALYPMDGAQPT